MLQLVQVSVDDDRQIDLVEINLLFQNQLQQQVKRTFIDGRSHVNRHCW